MSVNGSAAVATTATKIPDWLYKKAEAVGIPRGDVDKMPDQKAVLAAIKDKAVEPPPSSDQKSAAPEVKITTPAPNVHVKVEAPITVPEFGRTAAIPSFLRWLQAAIVGAAVWAAASPVVTRVVNALIP